MTAALKPFQQQTYYELLEIHPNASPDEIRAAYERASELYSPDSVAIYALENPAIADELRDRIKEAMEILTDADLRVEYDRTIGLTPRVAPAEVLRADERDEEDEEESPTSAKGMAEVVAPAAAAASVDSTNRELKISYVGTAADRAAPAAPAAPEAPPPNVIDEARMPEERGLTRPAPRLDSAPVLSHEAAIGEAEAALAQVSARAKEKDGTRPRPLEIPPDAEFNGELLRRVRESMGLTLAQIADRTRISSRHLENIEADRYKDLPTTVYLRGMLTSLARELRLDGNRVAKSYLGLVARKV